MRDLYNLTDLYTYPEDENQFDVCIIKSKFLEYMKKTRLYRCFRALAKDCAEFDFEIAVAGGVFSTFVNNTKINDIDVYTTINNVIILNKILKILYNRLIMEQYEVELYLQKNAINYVIKENDEVVTTIQFVTTGYANFELLVNTFDINLVRVVHNFNNNVTYMTKSAYDGFLNKKINIDYFQPSTKYRITKFIERGFSYHEKIDLPVYPTKNIKILTTRSLVDIDYIYDSLAKGQLYYKKEFDSIDLYVNVNVDFRYGYGDSRVIKLTNLILDIPLDDDTIDL
jgi:hypothetical protein